MSFRHAGGAAPGPGAGEHLIAARNRWSRAVLDFEGVASEAWCSLEARIAWDAEEEAGHALDFALVGFDFLAADGSGLDLDHVPGLARSLLDPHSAWIPGPAYQPAGSARTRTAALRIAFRVPAPACHLAVTVRSWRNTHPFTIVDARLRQAPDRDDAPGTRPRRLGPEAEPLRLDLVPGAGLVLRGQIYAARPDEHAARARIAYADAEGASIAPPYPDTVSVPGFGAVINLGAHQQTRRFTLNLKPPPGAASVTVAFERWEDADARDAVDLLAAPEIALEDDLRLESLCGDDVLDAPGFLERLGAALGLPPGARAAWVPDQAEAAAAPRALLALRTLQGLARPVPIPEDGALALRLAGKPDWPLPAAPEWREDPFRSVAWRLEYQSLAWLAGLRPPAEAAGTAGRDLAIRLAVGWSRANPWGQPADPLSLHPEALATRADALTDLLAAPLEAEAADVLVGEIVRHGFALAEIVGQGTLSHSLLQVRAAAALTGIARALPRLPLASYWDSLARTALAGSFPAALSEPALHRRLEVLTLGRALAAALDGAAPGPEIAGRVAAALPALSALLDPTGRLPPFGDSPAGIDHGAWLARLSAGQALVARLDAVPAPGPAIDAEAGTLAARADGPERGWSHFACTFPGQSPQGHADCGSFVFAAQSRRWIVEAGGSEQAETGPARHYLLSARAHNVAILDGAEPAAGRGRLLGSLALDGGSAHAIGTSVHGPDLRHVRTFVLLDDLAGVAVIDRFAGRGPLAFAGRAHLAPDAVLALSDPRRVLAQAEGRRLALVPLALDGAAAGVEILCGRDGRPGTMEGFLARGGGGLRPGNVLRYAFTGRDSVCGGLLIVVENGAEERLNRLLAGETLMRFLAGA
ncbi:heparinase II/III domain-containing protein [Methylobacterium oxalidis]|uniref:heparinase II/III domain-containing protein n=1 Tax=Methylobacterium oxalidis TaxID=944322 RepID=UPI001EE0F8EF|nr:heparinase II/III family protein [Methylobacterium oxalidis]